MKLVKSFINYGFIAFLLIFIACEAVAIYFAEFRAYPTPLVILMVSLLLTGYKLYQCATEVSIFKEDEVVSGVQKVKYVVSSLIIFGFISWSLIYLTVDSRLSPMDQQMSRNIFFNGIILGLMYGKDLKQRAINACIWAEGFTYVHWAIYTFNAFMYPLSQVTQ
jgi:hypothetical protein